jgi:hypothetical protein
MIVSTDPDYLDTKLVKQSKKHLYPIFKELANWIYQMFDTKVLNIYYDKIDTDNNRPRLNIIFEYYQDEYKFRDEIGNFDSIKQNIIATKFRESLTNLDTERVLVIFSAFEPVAREEATYKIPTIEIDKLRNELAIKEIWEIYRQFSLTTFFFFTDKQIEYFINNGTAEHIKMKYLELLKKHDEFDYFKPGTYFLDFDSKENFDKHFGSKWFNYSRR